MSSTNLKMVKQGYEKLGGYLQKKMNDPRASVTNFDESIMRDSIYVGADFDQMEMQVH